MSQYYKHFEIKGFEIIIVLMIFLVYHGQLKLAYLYFNHWDTTSLLALV